MRCGIVHDPACLKMGGMAGHAGLFSTADDISRFARMLLNGGKIGRVRILKTATVDKMTTPQSPPGGRTLRGFGWDIGPPLASNRDELPPVGSYGHLGFTGTALWIDPISKVYVIVLTNRVHPDGKGDVKMLRADIKALVADAIGPVSPEQIMTRQPLLGHYFNLQKNNAGLSEGRVLTGIDVLGEENYS